MKFKIFSDGIEVNTIISDEEFCKAYCERNGYTYKQLPEPEPMPEPEPTTDDVTWDSMAKAITEGVNDI